MTFYIITENELRSIQQLVQHVAKEYKTADDEEFLNEAYSLAGELPATVRRALAMLRDQGNHEGYLVIKGFKFSRHLPPTPKSWNSKDTYAANNEADFLGALLSSVLGDLFGYDTQQEGKLIHDIVPEEGKEYVQAGLSSKGTLSLHTEDAFHPCRGEFVCFCCFKNPTGTATTMSSLNSITLPKNIRTILQQDRFYTEPDNAHSVDGYVQEFTPILFGNLNSPYICVDQDFTHARERDTQAELALQLLLQELNSNAIDTVLQQGDYLFLDNYKWVHGRRPFTASYDGNDRWLKRFNISCDIKKSLPYRHHTSSRILLSFPA